MRELPRKLSVDELSELFEGRTRLVERLAEIEDPLDRAEEIVASLTEEEKVEALAAHPAIGQMAGLSARSAAEQGTEDEEAALSLGASGWQTFRRVTLPNVKWGLLYGVLLCNARAMGEFGAVSVLSGHVRGLTNTMPLQVEILYNDPGAYSAAFAVASLLALLGFVTLALKNFLEWRHGDELAALRGK